MPSNHIHPKTHPGGIKWRRHRHGEYISHDCEWVLLQDEDGWHIHRYGKPIRCRAQRTLGDAQRRVAWELNQPPQN